MERHVNRAFRARTLAWAAAGLAIAGIAGAGLAEPGWRHGQTGSRGGFGGVSIRIGGPVIERREPVRRHPVDAMPRDLQVTAYRSQGVTMVLVSGTNLGGGYTTALSDGGWRDGCATLTLINRATDECSTQALTRFSVSGSLRGVHGNEIGVRVAGRMVRACVIDVPVL